MSRPDATTTTIARAAALLDEVLDDLGPWLRRHSGSVDHTAKADGTPVTDADVEADLRLTTRIRDAFGDHGVLSEEGDTVAPDTDWCWVIDPIDGTSNFTAGLPYWCVSVALCLEGAPVLAVVDAPPLRRRTVATRGGGTTRDGERRHVRAPVNWRSGAHRHVPVMLTTGTARRARGAGLRLNPRVMGATALDLATVADGTAASSIALIPKVWDVAAGTLLVEEAGGVVRTLHGTPLLPLVPGTDYLERSAVTVAGPEASFVADIASALLPPI